MIISLHPNRLGKDPGFVYLVKCLSSNKYDFLIGCYKVGYTCRTVEERCKGIKSQIDGELQIVDYFWTEDPIREEAEIHYEMSDFHIWNEWFKIPAHLIEDEQKRTFWFSSDERGFVDSIYNEKPSGLKLSAK